MKAIHQKLREWSFPVGVMLAWLVATGFTVSALSTMSSAHRRGVPEVIAPAAPSAPSANPAA